MAAIDLSVDRAADVAYVRLAREPVVSTTQVSDAVLVDLDKHNIVVGIEVLNLAADLPFGELVDRFHVHTQVVDLLRQIRPSVQSYLFNSVTSKGSAGSHSEFAAQSYV